MKKFILVITGAVCLFTLGQAQNNSTIKEFLKTFTTYPFSDPSPVPDASSKIYPYFRYDGFTSTPQQKDWKVVSTEFDFIEPDKKKKYRKEKVIITPADTTTVTQQIIDTWEKIQNREFYIGCGKEDCHWCNFVKTNNLAIALHELEEEESEPGL